VPLPHVMSLVIMVNEKFREQVSAWPAFETRPEVFPAFFSAVVAAHDDEGTSLKEKSMIVKFLVNCFQSLENTMVRGVCLQQVALPLWLHLSRARLELEIRQAPQLEKKWKSMIKKQKKEGVDKSQGLFLPGLLESFFSSLSQISAEGKVELETRKYLERVLEFLIDLIAQLPTRRFFLAMLLDRQLIVRARLSPLAARPEGRLFTQLLDLLAFYQDFEINEHTGMPLSRDEVLARHYGKLQLLQRHAFALFPNELRDFALSNVGAIEGRETLHSYLAKLSKAQLKQLLGKVHLLPSPEETGKKSAAIWEDHKLLLEVGTMAHQRRVSQLDAINALPVYPNENLLWDENVVPSVNFSGLDVLALPKLNLQYLTFHDYLLRNFNLFRLESTYEIRQDVQDAALRLRPRIQPHSGRTVFTGWSRSCIPIEHFEVVEVAKPNLGETRPAHVLGEVSYSLQGIRDQRLLKEWEQFREHDILFLLTLRARYRQGEHPPNKEGKTKEDYCLAYIRGCEVQGMLDVDGKIYNPLDREGKGLPRGPERIVRVKLDPAQYALDAADKAAGGEEVYRTFNIMMKRKASENNFKAVLECIRDLMNTDIVVPEWLHDVLLGYGDPAACLYTSLNPLKTVDFNDTFLDSAHVEEYCAAVHPGAPVQFKPNAKGQTVSPYRVSFPSDSVNEVHVESYLPPDPGPYPEQARKTNSVRFTPVQIGAILSGTNEGLTQVVGPPGTGKTDTAVQIVSNIYHNFPGQRVLLVTHSNQALNDIFEKIAPLNIHERHLLRLGHDAEKLETEEDFSKWGRVNFMLQKRIELLGEVGRLANSLGVVGDVDYSCETAQHFYLFNVLSRWEEYEHKVRASKSAKDVVEKFPFAEFFSNAPEPVFKDVGDAFEDAMRAAEGCFRHLKYVFTFLDECRAFEILRTYQERAKYLITTQAKIIAMTCTHAALKRHDFVASGFEFDSIVMEESAQILEVETFIPMLLQAQPKGKPCRLKRVVLIGDHNQLPPVIQNMAFQKYSRMDQSLFSRFVRLGIPYIELNAQGRARPEIASLYNWRYKALGNMQHVSERPAFKLANGGFAHTFQFVDVGDLGGVGESQPTAYFYQNLAEAEYIAAVYMYMRLLGYPAHKISILSTYNGQVALLNDVIAARCGSHSALGMPHKIATVDKYQGQQNDFILLSLVRTNAIGAPQVPSPTSHL